MDTWDNSTKATVQKIPLLTVNAGPRDGDKWKSRLKEEFTVRVPDQSASTTRRRLHLSWKTDPS